MIGRGARSVVARGDARSGSSRDGGGLSPRAPRGPSSPSSPSSPRGTSGAASRRRGRPKPLRTLAGAALLAASCAALTPARDARAEAPYRLGPTLRAPPARVVTLAPSLTEIVLELGARRALVGVSRYDDAAEVSALPRVGGYLDPSPEAILALRPDLLLVEPSPGNRAVVERLAALGVPVLVLPLRNVADTLTSIRAVADALGRRDEGAAATARLEGALSRLRSCAGERTPRTLVVYGWQPLVAAGPGSFADELLSLVGAANAAAGLAGPYPTLSVEAVLASEPAHVLDASGGHGAMPPLEAFAPQVHKLRTSAFFRPGPRLVEAAEELCAILRPADGPAADASREVRGLAPKAGARGQR